MFTTPGEVTLGLSAGLHEADGVTYEIRYIDPAEAALWACKRGCVLSPEDIPPAVYAYLN